MKYFLLSFLVIQASFADSSKEKWNQVYTFFRGGNYQLAIDELKDLPPDDAFSYSNREYLLGICYARLQNFDQAIEHLNLALKLNSLAEDIYYELGQALFAAGRLPEAKEQFKYSIAKKFKRAESAYYIAYISESLGDQKLADDYYQRIIGLAKEESKSVRAVALFKVAELRLKRLESQKKNKDDTWKEIQKKILPYYEHIKETMPRTAAADEAEAKFQELVVKYGKEFPRMRNGVPIPKEPFLFRFSQDIKYDSNVVSKADESTLEVTHADSFALKPGFLLRYQENIKKTWSIIPELSSEYTYYTQRDEPVVYGSDNFIIAPAIRTRMEHFLYDSPSTLLLEVEENYTLQDYLREKKLLYYNRYLNFILGERSKPFQTGSTTLKLNAKFYESKDVDTNSISIGANLSQNFRYLEEYDLSVTLDFQRKTARLPINDQNSLRIAANTNFVEVWKKTDLNPFISLTVTDTKLQRPTRGYEFSFNPGVNISREYSKHLQGKLKYNFTRNWSRDVVNYQYKRHELSLGIEYDL